ncbi:MAG: dTDP-4-dehydrorhamnose reductase [Lachnospiraceae bacterium]|nr:dTDP-4-dehydrorhamnose reductase [Lachnospiraceae bacterium]
MKIFVTGACGQLGHDVINAAKARGHEAVGSDIFQDTEYVSLDITDREAVNSVIAEIKPDVIVHCAAWTAVDAAEDEENAEKVDKINRLGTLYISEAAKYADAKLIYLSTDYIFNGLGRKPWKPDDECFEPLNVYGRSKLDGELCVHAIMEKFYIVRISWVFGLSGKNFIKTMINVGKTHDSVRVVNDQIGTPTYTRDLAELLLDMAETDKYGIYHATNSESEPGGYISWYDFCCEFYRQYGLETKVIPVSSTEYGLSKAKRPMNSRLDKTKLSENGFKALPPWQDAVARYLKEAEL